MVPEPKVRVGDAGSRLGEASRRVREPGLRVPKPGFRDREQALRVPIPKLRKPNPKPAVGALTEAIERLSGRIVRRGCVPDDRFGRVSGDGFAADDHQQGRINHAGLRSVQRHTPEELDREVSSPGGRPSGRLPTDAGGHRAPDRGRNRVRYRARRSSGRTGRRDRRVGH